MTAPAADTTALSSFPRRLAQHFSPAALYRPVDASSLTIFRIVFGALVAYEVFSYWYFGWIYAYYIFPPFHFKYYGFEWVQPWPGNGMYWHYAVMGVAAICITLGLAYRVALVVFIVAFTYVFLLDSVRYLNHHYMVILFCVLLTLVPAHRQLSVDAWLRPSLRARYVPAWSVYVIRFQMEVILIYAGLVKLNPDWLSLASLSAWLQGESRFSVMEPIFAQTWAIAAGTYGVILLHLVGAPLLLIRRTRPWVFGAYVLFHTLNSRVFAIGIFPWITVLGTSMFFDPDWPRRLLGRIPPGTRSRGNDDAEPRLHPSDRRGRRWVLSFLAVWCAVQVLVPLRHFAYPGNVAWTEEGHRFSWRMMLRMKKARALFRVTDPATGETWIVHPGEYLTRDQALFMAQRPESIRQFAHYLARVWKRDKGISAVEVRATVLCSLNGREPALLVNPHRDLTKVSASLTPADWIIRSPAEGRPENFR